MGRSTRKGRTRKQSAQPVNKPMLAKFDLAQTTADNRKHWTNADGLSSRAATSYAVRRVVRIRSRYEAENNSWYSGIIRTAANHIVGGSGPRLQLLTGNPEANRRVEQAWNRWCRETDFAETIRMAVEAEWRDGEVFLMRAETPRFREITMDIRLIEADQVYAPWDTPAFDPWHDDGIRFDHQADEKLIYVYNHHPGGNVYETTNEGRWYAARKDIAHLFRAERPGQVRGIPRATPALQTLPIMRRQELATLYSAETAANFAMYLKSTSPAIDPTASPADFAEIELTRNMLTTLPAGWEIGQVEPKQPGPLYEMFQRQALMSFCRCTNMPYSLAAGTGKDSNFSSFKGDMKNVWEPEVAVERNRIETTVLEIVLRWFLNSAALSPGLLNGLPPITAIEHKWHWAPLPELDQTESASAAVTRMMHGLTTPSEELQRRGSDWDQASARAAADFGVTPQEYRQAVFRKLYDSPEATPASTESVVTTNTTAVADTAMNGAQVTSIVEIIGQVAAKVIPVATAKALIRSAFPAVAPQNIDEMLAPFAALPGTPGAVQAAPEAPQGEYTNLSQRDFNNNMKRIAKVLQQVAAGEISRVLAEQTLAAIGLSQERVNALLDDASDGTVDDPQLQEATA